MATGVDSEQLQLGRGKVYFDRLSDAGYLGERFLGDCSGFRLSTLDQERSLYSSADPKPVLIKRVVGRRLPQFSVTLSEYSRDNLALILMGDSLDFSQGSTPVVGESIGPILKGRFYKLSGRQVTAVVVRKGATPLVLGLDYGVDAQGGRIYIRPTLVGALEGDVLEVDFTPTAILQADEVAGSTRSAIEGLLRFVPDPASGPSWHLEIWRAGINSASGVGFLGQEFGTFRLHGSIQADPIGHPDEPYYRLIGQDLVPPAKVTDLTCDDASPGPGGIYCWFSWTASGDDFREGLAAAVAFRQRVGFEIITEADWDAATPVPGWDWKANTDPPGTNVVTYEGPFGDLLPTYLAVRYRDAAGNLGPISNQATTFPE